MFYLLYYSVNYFRLLNVTVILGSWNLLHCFRVNIHNANARLAISACCCYDPHAYFLCCLLRKYTVLFQYPIKIFNAQPMQT